MAMPVKAYVRLFCNYLFLGDSGICPFPWVLNPISYDQEVKAMQRSKYFAISAILLSCGLLFACSVGLVGTKIELKTYSPVLSKGLSVYKGKKIYLMNFDNQAQNTTIWYYYSPDKKFTYGGDSLIHNYFWYSFQKAMVNLGMEVSNVDRPDSQAPAMWMILKSITDDRFEGEVNLQKFGNPVFIKTYSVVAEPLGEKQRTPENLEKRAYDMTNRLIETILTDPEFKNAYFKAAAEMAAKQ
jgi:hypothetical protein